MFPELPKDLAALSDEDLADALEERLAIVRKVREKDEETLGDRDAATIVQELTAGVEQVEALKAEQTARAEAQENFENELAELTSKAGVTDDAKADTDAEGDESDEGDAEGDAADTDAEAAPEAEKAEEPVAVAASAKQFRRPLPKGSKRHQPQANAEPQGTALLASTQVYPQAEPGERLTTRRLAEVVTEMIRKNRLQYGQKVVVASATFDYPEDRQLGRDVATNYDRIASVNSPEALVASGGLCAPLTPIYDFQDVEVATRPVRDALANFRADRGGVILGGNPIITDYADAVGEVTEAEDAAGGTFAVKDCMRIECPDFTETTVTSIYKCIEAGNLTARAYPELMSRINTLVSANHARKAETLLLDGIRAGSTIVTGVNTTSTAGAIWKLAGHVHMAAAGMRSRHRMAEGARLRALFPEWIIDLLTVDQSRALEDRYVTEQQIRSLFSRANVTVTFYKDGPSTNTGQVFGAQSAGNLLGFPADTQWALFPEGSWLHLDSGSLDLGIVRDSTLNSTNDFQVFAETWENVAFQGVESLWITSTIAPNGTNSALKDYSASTNF